MSFEAKVYRILVASPGDVEEERKAIPEIISDWNFRNSDLMKVVLLPVKWETHSAPLMGERAQGVINNQIVKDCDMAIGVFWTRLGTATGLSESGTAEEIEWFIKNSKPVMLYFSSGQVDPTKLDLDQFKALKDFQKKMQKIGLTGSYGNITDFKEQLLRQLDVNVKAIISGSIKSISLEGQEEKIKTIKKIIKEGKVYMEDYEKDGRIKSFLVKGDTKAIKDKLKEMGGSWNNSLKGWIFSKSKEIQIAEFLKTNS